MSRTEILQPGQSYCFRRYFDLPYEADEILAEFGYRLCLSKLSLPAVEHIFERIPAIRQQIDEVLPFVSLSSEVARREVLVAPVLLEDVTVDFGRYCRGQLTAFK